MTCLHYQQQPKAHLAPPPLSPTQAEESTHTYTPPAERLLRRCITVMLLTAKLSEFCSEPFRGRENISAFRFVEPG
jgi:hypothetical protein